MKVQRVRGFRDVFPPESDRYSRISKVAESLLRPAGFERVYLPIVEPLELFARTIGETTDIVEKEMYTFPSRSGKKWYALRPEGTAGAARAYIEHSEKTQEPVSKIYYIGPMFRHERPQKGRQRQFYQLGVEYFGSASAWVDAEILLFCQNLWSKLGVEGITLRLNSLGCPDCRTPYRKRLIDDLRPQKDRLCEDCQRRIEKNPLRVLDCKERSCRTIAEELPRMRDSLCKGCREHWKVLLEALHLFKVAYREEPTLVRGLDYYTRTAFEYTTPHLGAQDAVAAGGRFDGLVEQLGGRPIPAIGLAIGLERLSALMEGAEESPIHLFVAALGEEAIRRIVPLIQELRGESIRVEWDPEGRSLKSQMRRADRLQAESVLIIGENEIRKGRAILRNLKTKEQNEIDLQEIRTVLVSRFQSIQFARRRAN